MALIQPNRVPAAQFQAGTDQNSAWLHLLAVETDRLERLGVAASLVTLNFDGSTNPARDLERTKRLLTYLLGPTDLFHVSSPSSATIVRAPVSSIADLAAWIHEVGRKLDAAGLTVEVGYALRRNNESLESTWARADASADRAFARRELTFEGLTIL